MSLKIAAAVTLSHILSFITGYLLCLYNSNDTLRKHGCEEG